MNQTNVQLLQIGDVERNSVSDIIGSGSMEMSNQDLLQMYIEKDEMETNSPADMIGSGPEYIGYLDITKPTKITEQDKAAMYAVASATHQPVPEIAKTKIIKPIIKAQVEQKSTL